MLGSEASSQLQTTKITNWHTDTALISALVLVTFRKTGTWPEIQIISVKISYFIHSNCTVVSRLQIFFVPQPPLLNSKPGQIYLIFCRTGLTDWPPCSWYLNSISLSLNVRRTLRVNQVSSSDNGENFCQSLVLWAWHHNLFLYHLKCSDTIARCSWLCQ